MSTPRSLIVPDNVRAVSLATSRGVLAALEVTPPEGTPMRGTALMVPGYTGSKEDFLAILPPLAEAGFRVVALDMRGQYESPGPEDVAAYELEEMGADLFAVADLLGAGRVHILGHSFGGLVARAATLLQPESVRSLTLLDTGPAPLTGHEAERLRLLLAGLEEYELHYVHEVMENMARQNGEYDGVPPEVLEFMRRRFLTSSKAGLIAFGRHLLDGPDRTEELAKTGVPVLVAYGEGEYVWKPPVQEDMARRLGTRSVEIEDAAHSPAWEQPSVTAQVLLDFWTGVEAGPRD